MAQFIDLVYARDDEGPVPWLFQTLATYPAAQFYTASEFALFKRTPLSFPSYVHLSTNYFNNAWSGERRLKNVVMALDWCPHNGESADETLHVAASAPPQLSAKQAGCLTTAVALFDGKAESGYTVVDAVSHDSFK